MKTIEIIAMFSDCSVFGMLHAPLAQLGFFMRQAAIFRTLKCLVLLFASFGVQSETISVNLTDLGSALDASRSQQDAVQRLILDEIQERLNELDLQLNNGELLFQDEVTDQRIGDGCNFTNIRRVTTEITLNGDTGLTLDIQSLFDPIELALDLSAQLNVFGRAQQVIGFQLGGCIELATDSFDFTAAGPLALSLNLSFVLNPEMVDANTLRVTPEISIDGELTSSDINVEVDDSLLRGVIENFLQDEIDDLFSPARVREELAGLQTTLDDQFDADLSDNFIDIELPPSDDEQILALYELLTPQARFPLTSEFLRLRRLDILAALILDDQDRIAEILEDGAFCQLTDSLQIDLPVENIYELQNGSCIVADNSQSGIRYGDSACTQSFEYTATDFATFCSVALDSNRLGNAMSDPSGLLKWSLSPGNRFEISALPIEGKKQPFSQRVNYKTVATQAGECALEMRVYKDNPISSGQRAVIALHGGSWQNRGTGFFGVENMATHFVDEGFVVFAPFYRLLSDSDGTVECHNATFDELLADVSDAFDWVEQNKAAYGVTGSTTVFGQSAGGHLAAYLATIRPLSIERAALFYAPADFTDFAEQIQSGEYTNETGINILERATGAEIEQLDFQSDLVTSNTFPALIEQQPEVYPIMFLLHGESDTLLPSRQSVRMCNSLSGDVESGPVPESTDVIGPRRTFACDDRGSQLHLIPEGEHTLDLCISDELCFAGSPASAQETADSIQQMLDWTVADQPLPAQPLQDQPLADQPPADQSLTDQTLADQSLVLASSRSLQSGTGTGSLGWVLLMMLLKCIWLRPGLPGLRKGSGRSVRWKFV